MDRKLFKAAASGDITFLQQVTDPIRDLDQVTPQKNTVLHITVIFKQLEFSKQVLRRRSLLLLKANEKGESPLHVAATMGCLEIAEHLVNSAKTMHQDIESGVTDRQEELLRMVNQENDTALHVAVKKGHLAVAKLLMEADLGLLEFVNNANASPLYLAVFGNFFSIVRCILDLSPASHFGGPRGMTALHSAVLHQHHDIVKLLVEKRPDMINEVDIHGRTPLLYAVGRGDLKTTQLLLKCNSSTAYLLDKDGTSALHVAAFVGRIPIVNVLIHFCPDIVELIDKKGRTALHVAIINRQEIVVRHILRRPELARIINEQDEDGNTALHLAVIHKRINMIKYLALDRRVEKTAMNKEFSTAFDIFLSQRNEPSYSAAKIHYFLRETGGLPYMQQLSDTCLMGEAREQEKSVSGAAKENSEEKTRSIFEIQMLVAMLIATVTFAAAFTMPGGYDDKGMATFIEKGMFKAFVIFNTTAFYFSTASVIIHIVTSSRSYSSRRRYIYFAGFLINIALYGMVLAFASGMYLVLRKSNGLAMTPYIMAVSCLLGYRVFIILSPRNFSGFVSKAAGEYVRNLLFRCGII